MVPWGVALSRCPASVAAPGRWSGREPRKALRLVWSLPEALLWGREPREGEDSVEFHLLSGSAPPGSP